MMKRLILALSAAILFSVPASAEALLPLNDGFYVDDVRLCEMSVDDMFHAYGDGVGIHTRSVNGSTFSHNYESSCTTTKVTADGENVTATMTCTGEGEEWINEQSFVIPNKDSFHHLAYDFVRCESPLAEDKQSPTTQKVIAQWHEANSTCRGSSDPDKYLPECGKRDVLDEILIERGWCYSRDDWSGADSVWHVCESNLKIIY